MDSVDLSRPFVELIHERHDEEPGLHLESDLKKINVVLVSYARALGTELNNLSVLHVCADSTHPHPEFVKHIASKSGDKNYIGQHISRLKKLIRNLPWPEAAKSCETAGSAILEDYLPLHLREVWFLLPRINGNDCLGKTKDERRQNRTLLALTARGLAVGLALLKVSKRYNLSDIRSLIEERTSAIRLALRVDNPIASRDTLGCAFDKFRSKVRAYKSYVVEKKQPISLRLDELQEPLASQVQIYLERARNGFKSDREIVKLAKIRYGLVIRCHSEETIRTYIEHFRLGLGHIYREQCIHVTDIRDLLKLEIKKVEVDGITIPELYNPLVDCYRNCSSVPMAGKNAEGTDSVSFEAFINALAAIAAFNGFLHLRKLFLKEYKPIVDNEVPKKRKEQKKETFDRPWLNSQIQRLRLEFYQIVNAGSFKSTLNGISSTEARQNLNLCLFYVALLSLRFLGVRQQSLRDCIMNKNIIFDSYKNITFYWPTSKNGKGIRHRLNMKDHSNTHKDLIDGIWTYYKKVYPYISGISTEEQSPVAREGRRKKVGDHFFLKCNVQGLCIPFKGQQQFAGWFTKKARIYLDFNGKPQGISFNPHFLRAMYGDWLRFDLRFSAEQAAEMAADSEKVFETYYITHPSTFDATDAWTMKNKEIVTLRNADNEKSIDKLPDQGVIQYQAHIAQMQETINTQALTIKQLTNKTS